jgi:CheY-like chemotaxis protein
MSHELRTPMNAIMGMTGLALRHATDPKLRDQLAKVEQASRHLLGVINDILDISKIEAEHLTLEHVSFGLGEVLENLVSLNGQKAREKGLKLRLDLAPEILGLSMLGDPLRLGQILLNFISNAIKFTEQGSITLHVRVADSTPNDVLLKFEIEDTGIGIAAEDQKRLFTAFEQADGSTTRRYGGTGLGLAINKRLTQMMGGEVGVESRVGVGSTFWFTVRLDKAQFAVAAAPTLSANAAEASLRTDFAGALVLLAEDEPINQEVSKGLLEEAGLVVDLARDGVEAPRNGKPHRLPADPDGHADAEPQRCRRDPGDPQGHAERCHADPRHDRQRIRGGPQGLPRGRHERPHSQTHQPGSAVRYPGEMAGPAGRVIGRCGAFDSFLRRNAILGRAATAEESEFLRQPGSSFEPVRKRTSRRRVNGIGGLSPAISGRCGLQEQMCLDGSGEWQALGQ